MKTSAIVPTLASRLGQTCHLSPLLRRIKGMVGAQDLSSCLMEAAVRRGASHYQHSYPAPAQYPTELDRLSNEELGVALCLGELPYNPLHIRIASELLSAPENDCGRIIHLSRQERCELAVRHIARCGRRVEPNIPVWERILAELEVREERPTDFLPGWTRFVSMTGVTRSGEKHIEWLRIHGARN